ncbi:hypothetical protein [Anaerotruncus colihominis]|uniref:hypothetical protein n=1 Tax=Anaerotruncus colihominis TaxID=169435 RepID=UPI001897E855|nr:hypothetical protein [Anaerotruncus colihominis]
MAEVHNSWQDTMGEPYQIPDNPVYDASNILRPTTMTPAHADMFNEIFSRLIVNTAAVKSIADSKAGTDTAASDQDGLMSKEDKTALDQAVLNIAALSGILGDGTAGGDLQGSYPNPAINPAKLVNIKPTFAQAESRAKIANGDTLAIILGKIAKMYVDLKAVAWSGSYADLTNKPSNFTPAAHTHDDRYFTETEITTKLNAKSDTTHTHTATQVGAAAVSSGTWTPNLNDAYNACFTNTNASGVWYRAGNIALFYFQTQLTRKSSNSANMYCTTPFAGHTFGEVILRGPTSPTLRKNWVLANTNTNSTWMLIPGGAFATESQMSVGTDFWYYGHGTVLL